MKIKTLRAAFIETIPIFAGYIFLGMAFGFLLSEAGYSPIFALFMSVFIYAGSMQFVAVSILASGLDLLTAAIVTLTVNARHMFYGLAMIEKFSKSGKYKPYLIFSLTDETFSLLCHVMVPEGIDESKFYFLISLLNHIYWISGCVFGALMSSGLSIQIKGIEFVMTAFFVVIFVEQWITLKNHIPALTGLIATGVCLIIFGKDKFLIPSMLGILVILLLLRKPIEEKGGIENVS